MKSLENRKHCSTVIRTPVGALTLVANDRGLAAVLWENDDPRRVPLGQAATGAEHPVPSPAPLGRASPDAEHPVLRKAARQLAEYFRGRRKTFDLALDFAGTKFQRDVWNALLTIPYGQTRSYAQIAKQIGSPAAVRAVGAANGRNPISIIAPCHRVIGSSGKLTGFAGGLDVKAKLLALEAAHC